jgi:exodeoxyribonuclease VII large subunit
MSLIEDPAPGPNTPEYTVSELAGAVKRTLEGGFARVRVRGEVGRVSRPASGHLYFTLKDDRAVLDAVVWKGQAAVLGLRPEEGIEVIATGRLTTFPASSKYQIVVETLEPAGLGALMLMLEKRKAALAAEGLFDAARKKPLPYLPTVIGVVTSPSGAVIRDILHRLRDRFPRHVLIWPVPVQGAACAAEVAAAIRGFNALPPGGAIPRPDLLIVARGGGSFEDLMGFNDEGVVRAAAASTIPLIAAVGHETDTTLIDLAADRRAPTPTAAAEMAVPVRLDLMAASDAFGARLMRAAAQTVALRRQRLRDLARALPRPEALTGAARQRADLAGERLRAALAVPVAAKRRQLAEAAAGLRPRLMADLVARARLRAAQAGVRLPLALGLRIARGRDRLDPLAARLAPARDRAIARAADAAARDRAALATLAARLDTALPARLAALRAAVEAADRLRASLGPAETLRRGYAIVRGDGAVVTTRAAAERAAALEIEFADGRLPLPPRRRKGGAAPPAQGSLF